MPVSEWQELQQATYARAAKLQERADRGEDVGYAERMAPMLERLANEAVAEHLRAH